MGLDYKKQIKIIEVSKMAFSVIGIVHLVAWVLQLFYITEGVYKLVNSVLFIIPNLFDKFLYQEIEFMGDTYTFGHVHTAVLMLIFWLILSKIEKDTSKKQIEFNKKEELRKAANREKEAKRIQEKIEKQKEMEIYKTDTFFGLFEFKLGFQKDAKIEDDEIRRLKTEYSKLIYTKIQEKYPEIKFILSDKIFLACSNFSLFDNMIKDFVKLYKILYSVDKTKNIKTSLLFAFWAGEKKCNPKDILKILTRVSVLNYINKIVVTEDFYVRYQKERGVSIDFNPIGTIELPKISENEDNLDASLYTYKCL